MKNCRTAARILAVVALFALPPLLLPDNAAAADRRYGNTSPRPGAYTDPRNVTPPPITQKQAKEMARAACKGLAYTTPTESKECLARNR
jgi:hypothetical protein